MSSLVHENPYDAINYVGAHWTMVLNIFVKSQFILN